MGCLLYARYYIKDTVVGGTRQTSSLPSCSFYSNGEDIAKKINMQRGKNCRRNGVGEVIGEGDQGRPFRGDYFSAKTWSVKVRVSQPR